MQASQAYSVEILGRRYSNPVPQTPKRSGVWISQEEFPLTPMTLDALFRNRIPAIRIKGFATPEECARMVEVIKKESQFEGYSYHETAGNVLKVGPAQCEYSAAEKNQYFSQAREAERLLGQIKETAFHPLERVQHYLQGCTLADVSVASEGSEWGGYFAGILRNISSGALLHMDYAPYDAKGWAIENIREQISWNLYLQAPSSGGEAKVYAKPWNQAAETYKVPGSYEYDRQVLGDAPSKAMEFVVGDLVIFNSRNFHEVSLSEGERLTMSSFVGRMDNGNTVLWS